MYIYHALINALSTHMIHINLNMIFYTHVEHSPTKTIYIKCYTKKRKKRKKRVLNLGLTVMGDTNRTGCIQVPRLVCVAHTASLISGMRGPCLCCTRNKIISGCRRQFGQLFVTLGSVFYNNTNSCILLAAISGNAIRNWLPCETRHIILVNHCI